MAAVEPHVELRGISKRYGGVHALLDVGIRIERGSIHGLVGENGAGKSTLGKVIAGIVQPDAGVMHVAGRPVTYRSPHDALEDGITTIAQELTLLPRRSIIDNVYLGIESRRAGILDGRAMHRRYRELTGRVGLDVPGNVSARTLRIADQQKVEILRALARNAELIVMDEPTASLGRDETQRLLDVVRVLAAGGTTVVFVSHFLDQVLEIADTVTVLKDGRLVRTSAARAETPAALVRALLGRTLEATFPDKRFPPEEAPVVLAARRVRRSGGLADVSLEVQQGEIVGLAGLIGSGRSEVARAIFGADRRDGGAMEVAGKSVRIRNPRDAIRAGIAMLPEDRKALGLTMNRSVLENITLPHLSALSRLGVVDPFAERRRASEIIRRVGVRAASPLAPVRTLSGGNQQKTLFARWLFRRPRVIIADEPTRGVDVGAKIGIYELLVSLAAEGMGVLLISSEIEEILGLAHRILVMRGGRIVAELDGRAATQDAVMSAAFGTVDEGAAA